MVGQDNVNEVLDMEHCQADRAEKRRRIQEFIAVQQVDAILISRHENIAWATGGAVDVRIGMLRETGVGSLLITKEGKGYYLTTNNEAPRLAREEFPELDYEPVVQPWYENDIQASIRKVVGAAKVAGDVPLGDTAPLSLQPLRLELTESEVVRYRWLGRHAARATSEVLLSLRPGMSEARMQAMLAERLISEGILPSVYLCAVEERIRNFRHAVPRRGVLERFGMIGFCAKRWGLTVSMTRFVHFGKVPAALDVKFAAVARVNAHLLKATREGVSSDSLFTVAAEAYASAGYPLEEKMHHQGGATGYAEREWVARPGGTEHVLAQQAFAWNPNLDGAKVEDTVLLHQGSIEMLTATPELPVVMTDLDGTEYFSAGVLVN